MAIDRSDAEYAALRKMDLVGELAASAQPVAEIPQYSDRVPRRLERSAPTADRVAAHSPPPRKPAYVTAMVRQTPFTPEVITIHTAAAPTNIAKTLPQSRSGSRGESPDIRNHRSPILKMSKNSFLAKALPVIKKPYEWAKSLGSKLF